MPPAPHSKRRPLSTLQARLNGLPGALLFEYLAYTGDRKAALALLDDVEDNRLPKAGQPNGWGTWTMLLSAVEGLVRTGRA